MHTSTHSSVSGIWLNEYNSRMTLHQSDAGLVTGIYESSTGSTGKYRVLGHADPACAADGPGQSLALAISWRSIAGGAADPSWHWVSGLGGQSLTLDGTPSMILMHALVATLDFPNFAAVGTYADKLVYKKIADAVETAAELPAGASGDLGEWVCVEHPAVSLRLGAPDPGSGAVAGVLRMDGASHEVRGFTDVHAAGLRLRGLALTAWIRAAAGGAASVSLAGRLDTHDGILSLLRMTSQGTSPANRYLQTTAEGLTFRRP